MTHNPFQVSSIGRKFKRGKNLSFDEAFLDMKSEEPEILDDEKESLNYRMLLALVFFGLCILGLRLIFLQVIKGPEYQALAEGNKLRTQYVLAPRGLILDRFGEVIAANVPSFEVVVLSPDLPKDLVEFKSNLTKVSEILARSYDELLEKIKVMDQNSYQAQTLVEDITKEQALILIGQGGELKGFGVQNNPIRDYKEAPIFAHLSGYVGKITEEELTANQNQGYILNDYIGKTGIEYQYENYLRGSLGKRQTEIDAGGNFKKTLAEVPAVAGRNVGLNIDFGLQKQIYESLIRMMKSRGTKRAAAVAINPQTGEVLALLSLPAFDNNSFAKGISNDDYQAIINDANTPLLNRVVSGAYPPGSTIKPMLAVAALTEGVVTPQTKILDDGVIFVGAYSFYGYERTGLGVMDIYSAIARSSDIYFYSIGGGNPKSVVKEGLGPERIAEYFRKFHLGQTLGIDLPNEKPGLVPDPAWKDQVRGESWYLGDTYHESIGQGDVLTTPLQVNSWTATIANGGKIMQPYLLKEVKDKNGQAVALGKPQVLAENIFDPKFIKVAQDGMRQAVTDGSARALAGLSLAIAGKTGTAQFDARNLSLTHAWFTSYAPANDPQIALTILVESGGEGSTTAGPIAKKNYHFFYSNSYK